MSYDPIPKIGPLRGLEEIPGAKPAAPRMGEAFAETLEQAIRKVDELQKDSETQQAAYASGEPVDLHDVLIKIEEAEIAFKAMMEVRTKLVDAYREIMRMGSGG